MHTGFRSLRLQHVTTFLLEALNENPSLLAIKLTHSSKVSAEVAQLHEIRKHFLV
jgi:hypothetical protein